MQLYSYFRSSTSFRVRIALNIKGLSHTILPVNIRANDHHSPEYLAVNAQGVVPTLIDQGQPLTQSLAILEYLEERYPTPALLPVDSMDRAHVRSVAQLIACDIHPLNNLKVLKYLQGEMGLNDGQKDAWYHHWIVTAFKDLEKILIPSAANFCFGHSVTLADVCLIPQVYNAIRFKVDLSPFPTLARIYSHCLSLPEFFRAVPENQIDWSE